MNLTVRFKSLLEKAEEIAKESGLECIDSYCITRAMLEGDIYNICYLAFLNMGYSIDRFLEELERINNMRGPLNQRSDDPLSKPV